MGSFSKVVVLLGDSITQYSFSPRGWGGAVANLAQRKCDVFNRGFSGYNSKDIYEHVLPNKCMEFDTNSIAALTIFLGANDSVSPGHDQHVSVDDYSSYMTKIIRHFVDGGLPSDKIILITPPPVDAETWAKEMIMRGYGDGQSNRHNETTRNYADACIKIAKEQKCRYVDIWHAIKKPELFSSYLVDGLHFNENGNIFLSDLLEPHLNALLESVPMQLPDWKDLQ